MSQPVPSPIVTKIKTRFWKPSVHPHSSYGKMTAVGPLGFRAYSTPLIPATRDSYSLNRRSYTRGCGHRRAGFRFRLARVVHDWAKRACHYHSSLAIIANLHHRSGRFASSFIHLLLKTVQLPLIHLHHPSSPLIPNSLRQITSRTASTAEPTETKRMEGSIRSPRRSNVEFHKVDILSI